MADLFILVLSIVLDNAERINPKTFLTQYLAEINGITNCFWYLTALIV